jgi:EAL domain-containing protein (putative c-di-GMP-specific phosphodiesterase class I)
MALSVDAPSVASRPGHPPFADVPVTQAMDEPPMAPRFRVATSARSAAADRRRREQELRHALIGGELAVCYAARLSLETGVLDAAEAVIRWPHRRRGLMPAAEFLPLAESAGLAAQVGGWVLLEACRAATGWQGGAVVCVDVAGTHVEQDGLLDQVALALETSGLPPDRLEIELSETGLTDCLDEQLLRLAALRDLGVGVALDEFGTGAASLSLLRRLPLTTVKLDGSMLRDVVVSREDRAILHAVIQAAHALGLTAVATGIETEDQRAMLAAMACDAGQGPLFGAPLPPTWTGDL